jgi:putative heme iron utilization protein
MTEREHGGAPSTPEAAPAPEPTFAERARTLVAQGRAATFATASRRHDGHPFASVMPYAVDDHGAPVLLISTMAVHTQNVAADPRSSLLVAQPGAEGDPLAAARVTLMGEVRRIGDAAAERARYLARHPTAAAWVDFGDFAFWRLHVADVYFVGGFAAMGWVGAAEYAAALPDPLADVAVQIVDHMNRDHAAALVTYARAYAGVVVDAAEMVAVDRLGFKLRISQGRRRSSVRIGFPREVATAADSREVLIEMLRRARG